MFFKSKLFRKFKNSDFSVSRIGVEPRLSSKLFLIYKLKCSQIYTLMNKNKQLRQKLRKNNIACVKSTRNGKVVTLF
jgi:hypothetical protein